MLTIWGRTSSINVQKVMWVVGELGLSHERIDAGTGFGIVDTPEYRMMNPNKLIPVIKDGETVVWESNACVRYLAARYGAGSLWPSEPALRALSDRWMDWQLGPLLQDTQAIFLALVRTPPERRDPAAIAAAAERLGPRWRILDENLSCSAFVAGDQLTIGDVPLGCLYWRYSNLDIPRPELPSCQRWLEGLNARPAYREHVMLPLT